MPEVQFFATVIGNLLLIFLLVWLARITTALSRLDRLVSLLVKQAGINVEELARREAEPLVRDGKKIEAIRVYRDLTGAGLAAAKAAVERMQNG